jgi:hypothetical protein
MISERKLAANRRNAKKSTGPRTSAGKLTVSRNALRHGLAALRHLDARPARDIDLMAMALCGDGVDQPLFEQARLIAESYLLLQRIRDEAVGLIERLRNRDAVALAHETFRLQKLRVLAREAQSDAAFAELQERQERFNRLSGEEQARLLDEYEQELEKLQSQPAPIEERDEGAALMAALPDLEGLARYERRAWSCYRRAFRNFLAIKFGEQPLEPPPGPALNHRSC